jgi:hypothetical protein
MRNPWEEHDNVTIRDICMFDRQGGKEETMAESHGLSDFYHRNSKETNDPSSHRISSLIL